MDSVNAPSKTVIVMCLEPPGSQTRAKHDARGGERHIRSAVSAVEPEECRGRNSSSASALA